MAKRKKLTNVQVFDPESFDIHANEKSFRSRIWPLEKKEKMVKIRKDMKVWKGEEKVGNEKKPRSVLIALLSNILVPGLGNAYVEPTPFSISILVLSILVIFTTFSPVFPIVGLLSAANIAQPSTPEVGAATLMVPSNVLVDGQALLVGPTFSILIVPLLLAWIHLLFLFLNDGKIRWKP